MIDVSQYLKLLPYSLSHDPVLVAMMEAVVIQFREAYVEAEALYDLVNIDKLPERLLDLIAYEKHVDFYDNELSVMQKRELIKSSISWHRKKGTRWAVERVVAIVYKNAEVFEWFEYGGEKYRFCIYIDEPFIHAKDMRRLLELVDATKNKRSWLEYVAIKLRQPEKLVLSEFQYSYPVYYHKCGELVTHPILGLGLQSTLGLADYQYKYPIYYNPSDTFNTHLMPGEIFEGSLSLEHHQSRYPVYYPATDTFNTELLAGDGDKSNTQISHHSASMTVPYLACGTFLAGGGF